MNSFMRLLPLLGGIMTALNLLILMFTLSNRGLTLLANRFAKLATKPSHEEKQLYQSIHGLHDDFNDYKALQKREWRDNIKVTLILLMEQDNPEMLGNIEYELSKLIQLDAHCWLIPQVQEYIRKYKRVETNNKTDWRIR